MPERLFTTQQVAELLGATPADVLQWIRNGWLPCQHLPDGPVRIAERGVVQFLKSRGVDLGRLAASAIGPDADGIAADASGTEAAPDSADAEAPPPASVLAKPALRSAPPTVPEAVPDETQTSGAEPRPAPPAPSPAPGPTAARPAEPPGMPPPTGAPRATPARPRARKPSGRARTTRRAARRPKRAGASRGRASPADAASQLADAILADAISLGADHVHLEPAPPSLALRLRIGGVLHEKPKFAKQLPEHLAPQLVRRLLEMAGLAESDAARPLAGRISWRNRGRTVQLRLSSFPTPAGPRLVLAIGDRQGPAPSLRRLGFGRQAARQLEAALLAPDGGLIVAVGGPRSGREQTAPALAAVLRKAGRDVLAWADVDGRAPATGEPGGPLAGLTPAEAARALTSQDADAIVTGALREPATAAAALAAALEGNMVLADVCASTAPAALRLLAEMRLPAWPLASVLRGVAVHARVRRLCDACKRARKRLPPGSRGRLATLGLDGGQARASLRYPAGCERCGQTGYAGRLELRSVLLPDDALVAALRDGADAHALAAAVRDGNARSIRDVAAERLLAGETSLTELARVLGL